MSRIIDQFVRKRCQKKRKDVDYKFLKEFFQKYFVLDEQSVVKNLFSTYVCYAPDGLFWLNLYLSIFKHTSTTHCASTLVRTMGKSASFFVIFVEKDKLSQLFAYPEKMTIKLATRALIPRVSIHNLSSEPNLANIFKYLVAGQRWKVDV